MLNENYRHAEIITLGQEGTSSNLGSLFTQCWVLVTASALLLYLSGCIDLDHSEIITHWDEHGLHTQISNFPMTHTLFPSCRLQTLS